MSKEVDVVIIGSGVGGLCCAALLAKYGYRVTVCESHTIPGGAAHSFERNGYKFDSGPSLYSGLSTSPSNNPLRQVLDAIEEDLAWA
ncbi:MAG: phytoene desaturase family protein, partial [Waterburya sp.]